MVHKPQTQVVEFHEAFLIPAAAKPRLIDPPTALLRLSLIQEEFSELVRGISSNNLPDIADALADLLYVTYGTAVSYGIDIEPIFEEVHETNMAKLGGGHRSDGKILKPEGWCPPNTYPLLIEQGWGGAK